MTRPLVLARLWDAPSELEAARRDWQRALAEVRAAKLVGDTRRQHAALCLARKATTNVVRLEVRR